MTWVTSLSTHALVSAYPSSRGEGPSTADQRPHVLVEAACSHRRATAERCNEVLARPHMPYSKHASSTCVGGQRRGWGGEWIGEWPIKSHLRTKP
jgi:hypothetical protein